MKIINYLIKNGILSQELKYNILDNLIEKNKEELLYSWFSFQKNLNQKDKMYVKKVLEKQQLENRIKILLLSLIEGENIVIDEYKEETINSDINLEYVSILDEYIYMDNANEILAYIDEELNNYEDRINFCYVYYYYYITTRNDKKLEKLFKILRQKKKISNNEIKLGLKKIYNDKKQLEIDYPNVKYKLININKIMIN